MSTDDEITILPIKPTNNPEFLGPSDQKAKSPPAQKEPDLISLFLILCFLSAITCAIYNGAKLIKLKNELRGTPESQSPTHK